ncbi:MAG: monovalent cation/H+ antiporter complex subunit F [Hydrogenophaga sp.]|uniref:monovalent cation/H+ antiporter complex subunit F n=1 Tax=Hydrogenophaga sp. TaxID=1904254 RepID=UPI00275BD962|nr:monovalent cation/H+ antiporter complex subunit F [Hydrogenophaga sp.]MDP2416033.1 monovalent cation/H+ antiporter complex subunit F [Hydrogenophaga sp.]MDZ4189946.1 monovalent cation/H+ antiporter complex subunit F [Hydrogenophaga sp.]
MNNLLLGAGLAILVTMALALIRGLKGPEIYDRVLAANVIGTKTVLLMALVALLYGRPDFLDLALAYALINFIGILAILQFVQNREARRQIERATEKGRT